MNFQELGLALRHERESKGLSIKAVIEATKISRINLVALENGDRSSLPHPVYTKGFVKSYARLLGLDADELSMVIDREYQAEEQDAGSVAYDVSPHAEKAFHESDAPVKSKRSVWPSILIVVILACAVLVLVLNLNKSDVSKVEPTVAPVETVEEPAQPVEPAEELPIPEAVQPDQEAPEVTPEPTEPAAQPAAAPAPAAPDVAEDEAADMQAASPEAAKYAHVLIIRATSEKGCWIGVWRGDETDMARDFVLTKGEPLRLMFNSPRRIRIGNAAGVTVTYNGDPYPLDSAKGNIQTLLFGM